MTKGMALAEIREIYTDAARGDVAAREFLDSLFSPHDECFWCTRPSGTARQVIFWPDPAIKPIGSMAIVAVECLACRARPDHADRVRSVLRATWPGMRWDYKKDRDPSYLRRRPPA
jgi:hypothetical protein